MDFVEHENVDFFNYTWHILKQLFEQAVGGVMERMMVVNRITWIRIPYQTFLKSATNTLINGSTW